MGKYEPLGEFLHKQRTREVPLTFTDIERITGVKLPPKAQHHRAWWSNNPNNNVMTKVWLAAGFETSQVDMGGRKLVFRRVRKAVGAAEKPARQAKPLSGAPKDHPLWGALKDVTIVPPGVDLTEPADPEWGKVYD